MKRRVQRAFINVWPKLLPSQGREAGLWRDPDLGVALTWREESKPNDLGEALSR